MTFISYAQNFEDVLLWRVFQNIPNGFYIDVGASLPDSDSVTRAFYDRGWCGINIEPVQADFIRLAAARARDVNLNIALGEQAGSVNFFVVPGTGLSTFEAGSLAGIEQAGFSYHDVHVEMRTLAQICDEHVTREIHFLKIDVEGGEREVVAGADFTKYRPWIVIVEATLPMSTVQNHMAWEHMLIAGRYQFAWFDGLNRFYVAEEHWQKLGVHFMTPVNVFDDFIRVADTEWARRINQAETRATVLAERCAVIEGKYVLAIESSARNLVERHQALQEKARISEEKNQTLQDRARILDEKNQAVQTVEVLRGELSNACGQTQNEIAAIYNSTSWRVTGPIRLLKKTLSRFAILKDNETSPEAPQQAAQELLPFRAAPVNVPGSEITAPAVVFHTKRLGLKHAVHQFHAGSAFADAITNAMLLTRRILRSMGYASEIFVIYRDPLLADELRLFDEIPRDDHYVLILHHSMGFDWFDEVAALPAAKVLIYHNITPTDLLAGNLHLQAYSKLGREQLVKLRPLVRVALADSEYNAIELHSLGFASVQSCMLLFDTNALRCRKVPRFTSGVFTILFVGRVIESKGQLDLVLAYLFFRVTFNAPSRLVIVGRYETNSSYYEQLKTLTDSDELRPHVTLTGVISDQALDALYAEADLYVSVSQHEGFGVPLVEAMANGVPVLAWPCGAVSFTLGRDAALLASRSPEDVAMHMLSLANDPELRARIVRQQYGSLARFDLKNHIPILAKALEVAGAQPSVDPATIALLKSNATFVVTGHLTTSYSLAAVNRTLALAIEKFRPGRLRLVPVEAEKSFVASRVPPRVRDGMLLLAGRPKADRGPVIVISQHYPVHIPKDRGDLLLSLFFWEESVVPAATIDLLSENFSGVLAPSRFVAKVLVDSGLSIPICHIEYFPDLSEFEKLPVGDDKNEKFTFLHVSSCFPRKGVDLLLRAYASAFKSNDKVRLMIKGVPNPHNIVAKQIAELREQHAELAEIVLIDEEVEERGILELFAQTDAVVLPTRGEGFNLPAAEALAAGIPLIVTGYGGHMDFCTAQDTRLLDYTFAKSESHLANGQSVWVEPDCNDLASAMQAAFSMGKRANSGPAKFPSEKFEFGAKAEAQIAKLESFAIRTLVTPLPQHTIAWISTWNVRCGIAGYSKLLIEHLTPSDRIGAITVLADERTDPENGNVPVLPCWQIGSPETLQSLLKAVTITGADVVVIQHQPSIISWNVLTQLLITLVQRGKVVTVTLHNTLNLWDIEAVDRASLLGALSGIARVVVHTVADLNLMKTFGLVENTVMISQGITFPRHLTKARHLSSSDVVVIGCYGFFLPGKGIPQLIESLRILRMKWPKAILRLVNAEYDNSESKIEIQNCLDIATKEGLATSIEWHTDFFTNQESLTLLTECDVIALPYQYSKEASSAALRNALGAGPPVMVTPIAIFDEACEAVERFSGIKSAEIAAGLDEIIGNQTRREQSMAQAEAWMSSRSWTSISERMKGMLLGLALQAKNSNLDP